jgi:protein SCO1/2
MRARRLLAVAVLLAVSGSIAASAGAGAKASYRGTALDPPLKAPHFALHDQAGKLVSFTPTHGKLTVVAFLYTHCTDVCPVIAQKLNGALRTLGSDRSSVRVLAISVDPKRDTSRAVRHFVEVHRLLPQFRYLTGTRKQLAPIWAGFHIAATPGPNGIVSHSAFELLIDPQGRERVLYDSRVQSSDVVHDVRLLLGRR